MTIIKKMENEKYGEGKSMLIIDYDEHHYNEWFDDSIESAYKRIDKSTATWININCICDTILTDGISEYFGFSHLVKSNLSSLDAWSTYLVYPEYTYLSLNTIQFDLKQFNLVVDRVCCVLGDELLLTFQENSGSLFSKLRERIKESTGIVRRVGVDYLQYLLLNTIFDQVETQLQTTNTLILEMEKEEVELSKEQLINQCYKLKKLLIKAEQYILPQLLSVKKITEKKAFIKDAHLCFYEDVQSKAYTMEIVLKAQIQRLSNIQCKIHQPC